MSDIHYNPLQTIGFEFVEYTAPDAQGIAALKDLFVKLGFTEVAKHKSKDVWLYKQNDINFIINADVGGQAEAFAKAHGASVCGMAWRVADAKQALEHAVAKGAKPFQRQVNAGEAEFPAVYGIGESVLSFVDNDIYAVDFEFHENWEENMKA